MPTYVPIFTHPCAIELRFERPKRLFGFDGTAGVVTSFPAASDDLGDCELSPATAPTILTDPAQTKLQGDPTLFDWRRFKKLGSLPSARVAGLAGNDKQI